MDESVLAAIAKWPNVPAVFGWLSLTARGEWRLRDEPIANAALREFIGRNFAADEQGRWFFQNGPQRVYVQLELAPWVFRVQRDGALRTHTGVAPSKIRKAAIVNGSMFVLLTDLGAGNIDDRDAALFLAALTKASGRPLDEGDLERALRGDLGAAVCPSRCGLPGAPVPLARLSQAQLALEYGFEPQPQAG
jgi:hypothetical protein